ncbi:DUF2357 domain-containing protein [Chitinophaga oryziterrae]|nr:DUF2357 domain-containing protein [Chitinophaga oryziterrae]
MEIIIIRHADFLVRIFAAYEEAESSFYETFIKIKERDREEYFTTEYLFSDMSLLEEFYIWNPETESLKKETITSVKQPVFFENRLYKVKIEFLGDIISIPRVYSKNKQVTREFTVMETVNGTYQLDGNLRYQQDVGFFDLRISYDRGTIPKTIVFRFEVFSVRMPLKKHFPLMIHDIEVVYPRLVLDYMKITYHNADSVPGTYSDMLWWIFFDNVYQNILRSFDFILNRPYTKNERIERIKREIRIENATNVLQGKIDKFTGDPNKHFVLAGNKSLNDNYENRVVKFILKDIIGKYERVNKRVKAHEVCKRMTNEYRAQLDYAYKALGWIPEQPLFQIVRDIENIDKITYVLANKDGYESLIEDWGKLKKGYRLFEGLYEIELKNIDYLYRLWCFLEMVELVKSLGGKKVKVIKLPETTRDQFILSADNDMSSKIVLEFGNGNVVELYQELLFDSKFDKNDSGVGRGTVRPDIVLRVRKKDLPDNLYLTYLFNVRYRVVKSDDINLPDLPYEGDMDRLHTFRNVIYHREKGKNKLSREVMGAYLLYPGQGTLVQIENLNSQMPPDICGIPFCPGQDLTNALLKNRISYIINTEAVKLLRESHPQKGKAYRREETFVFIPFIKEEDFVRVHYLQSAEMPLFDYKSFLPALGEGTLRYFAHYVEGKGIKYVYEIVSHYWKARKDVYPPDHELFRDETRKCLVLKLGNKRTLDEYLQIKGVVSNIRYTKMEYINNPVNGFIKTITERDTLLGGENS